jgi:hypothetical protein
VPTHFAIIIGMNSKHKKTLKAIFADQVNGNMEWREIEALLVAIGCRVLEGNGSTVTLEKDGLRATFHRPHPDKDALRYRVRDARNFLTELRVKP